MIAVQPRPPGGHCCEAYPHYCPGCSRVMSHREAAEQGACNDCHGGWTGADWPAGPLGEVER